MKTTVMFVADSVPLGGAPVCLAGGGDDELYVTDVEGKIDFDLDLGTHTFKIQVEDTWVERTVHREGHAPLFVVNVRQSDMQSLTTLNTLQIDLSNLVGDRYVFETVLGRGGMGVVVKAVDRMLNRPVAIKMLSDELRENEEAQQIFLVEARNLATLSHPNLVAIHDILNVSGRVLMVFEYVLGENVEKTIKKKGRLDQKAVLRIAIQLTRCVAYLHEHELIHRDLKPANIIMQADGTLKLIDFGLARSLNELYVRGTRVRGTPAYMAPEQIQGIHLTTATDIYQLGISMYEMLRGGLPFAAGDMAYAHVHLEPPPLTEAGLDIDAELARVVHACLSKQPRDRPGSAEMLLEQLQHIYARLASGESQQFAAFDRIATGPLPALSPSSTGEDIQIVDIGELSFADEVVGGTNRGLAIMAGVGLLALMVAGWFLFGGSRQPAPEAPTPVAAVAPAPTEPPVIAPEVHGEDRDQPVIAARGLVGLSLATATGQASGIASAAAPADAPDPQPRKVAHRPARAHTPRPARAHTHVARPQPTPDDAPELAETAPAKPKPKPAAPAKARDKDDAPKGNGLLSVDSQKSKSLLPVSN